MFTINLWMPVSRSTISSWTFWNSLFSPVSGISEYSHFNADCVPPNFLTFIYIFQETKFEEIVNILLTDCTSCVTWLFLTAISICWFLLIFLYPVNWGMYWCRSELAWNKDTRSPFHSELNFKIKSVAYSSQGSLHRSARLLYPTGGWQ